MLYGEIVIGPPGSGKSTYVTYKKDILKDRKVITVNLDPGNLSTDFDYDIKSLSSTRKYMKDNDLGPNYSVKCILKEFYDKYDEFSDLIRKNEEAYFIFDFPGQVEFFMCDGTLRKFTQKLVKEGMYLVCVNLVDISFFIEMNQRLSSYLMCTVAMIQLELPHVVVLSKCDLFHEFDIKNLEDILLCNNVEVNEKDLFYQNMLEVVNNEGLLLYEILDYDNLDAMMYLQMIIDKASGYFFNEEPYYEGVSKEQVLAKYYKKLE